MLLECESCGAPLDVASGTTVVRCHYCGRSETVERFRKVAAETPQDFVPPRQWTPPDSASLPSRPLKYRPRRRSGGGGFLSLMVLGIGGYFLWHNIVAAKVPPEPAVKSMVGQALDIVGNVVDLAKAKQAAASGASGGVVPVICKGTDDLTITGKTLSLAAGVPVVALDNCKLRLVACTVSGSTGITASGNSKITMEGGSITGKGPAVVLNGHANLDASGASLTGDMTITATANARARLRGSSITGTHVAIHSSGNASVDTSGSTVHGRVLGHGAR